MTTGGGATHIATVAGTLRAIGSTTNLLMVSGGGGGAYESTNGADAGGISGSGSNSGTQSTGYMFGQGQYEVAGGGGGLYGGSAQGGAGSGYIGNTSVKNKKMVGYEVPTSDTESTKTESVSSYNAKGSTDRPKSGNGKVRIRRLELWGGEEVEILACGDTNNMTVQVSSGALLFKLYSGETVVYSFTAYSGTSVYDTDNIYVGFLIDTDLELAKPSMVYVNGSVYSYNQEEPDDETMADIYAWINPGLSQEGGE